MLVWIARTIGIGIAKGITLGEYNRIKNENKRAGDYAIFIALLEKVAKKRLVTCKKDELSRDCPMSFVLNQYYQRGNTTDGTAPLRSFIIIGLDGQIITIQGFDLTKTVKVTVQHTNGTFDMENIDPSEALKRIEREGGYRP